MDPHMETQWEYFEGEKVVAFDPASSEALNAAFEALRFQQADGLVDLPDGRKANLLTQRVSDASGGKPVPFHIKWKESVLYQLNTYSAPSDYYNEEEQGMLDKHCVAVWLWWVGSWSHFEDDETRRMDPRWALYGDSDMAELERGHTAWQHDKALVQHQFNGLYSADYSCMFQFRTQNVTKQRPIRREVLQWFWEDKDKNEWMPYSPKETITIERAYVARMPQVILKIGDAEYEINLVEMCQYRHEQKFYRRGIRRVGPPMSPEHSKGIKMGGELMMFNQQIPRHWTPETFGTGTDLFRLVDLDLVTQEASNITSLLNDTIAKRGHKDKYGTVAGLGLDPKYFEVTKITRVQNKRLWDKYVAAKLQVCQKWGMKVESLESSQYVRENPFIVPLQDAKANEYYFWHGCQFTPFISQVILGGGKDGFDNRLASAKGMYGAGIYFAENSSKSNQYVPCSSCKHGHINTPLKCSCDYKPETPNPHAMLLCRVTLGDIYVSKDDSSEIAKNGYNAPKAPDGKLYDSVLGESVEHGGSELYYREVIIYNRALVYPEYIVYYNRHESRP